MGSRQHSALSGCTTRPFPLALRWTSGRADVAALDLDERLATGMRVLVQRSQGRDRFDPAPGPVDELSNAGRIVTAVRVCRECGGYRVARSRFERKLAGKGGHAQSRADRVALLRPGFGWQVPGERVRESMDEVGWSVTGTAMRPGGERGAHPAGGTARLRAVSSLR